MTENELTQYYAELLDYACRRCRTMREAEEVASDTILAVLTDIRMGKVIDHPIAYMRGVFANKHNEWLRRRYQDSIVVWDDGTMLSRVRESHIDAREMAQREFDEAKVRRELGRLTAIYREVMVRYYMKGERVDAIAAALGIPVGTVKRRLAAGREQVRDGIVMQEKRYSNLSYAPKSLHIGIWGNSSTRNEPFSLVYPSKIAQNLLILAYEKPTSPKVLADALGIPLPYIEPELDKLVQGELMGKTSGGLYYTRIYLCDYNDSYGDIPAQEALAEEVCEALWTVFREGIAPVFEWDEYRAMSEKQRSTLLLYCLMVQIDGCVKYILEQLTTLPESIPERPNGGSWLAAGSWRDEGTPVHRYDSSGPVWVSTARPDGSGIDCMMRDYQSCFGDTHWVYGGLKYSFTLREILKFYVSFVTDRVTPDDPRIYELAPDFKRLHILRQDGDKMALDIPALPWVRHNECGRLLGKMNAAFDHILGERLKALILVHDNKLPAHVDAPEYYRHYGAARALPLAVLLAVVRRGLLPHPVVVGETPIIYVAY
ncbi:MAG: RNA polymerase sigma factor [Clostridia bacterium]|nr:RNA polymerase sigma factor [Clostridia bacterium]